MTVEKLSKFMLGELEKQREVKRKQGRITFDCQNLRYCELDKNRVTCSAGHRLSQSVDGNLTEVAVLKGISSSECLECKDYKGE